MLNNKICLFHINRTDSSGVLAFAACVVSGSNTGMENDRIFSTNISNIWAYIAVDQTYASIMEILPWKVPSPIQ